MAFVPTVDASRVLVTVGVGHAASALGRQEAHRAGMIRGPNQIGFAAADAKLVTVDPESPPDSPVFRLPDGSSVSTSEIETRWGAEVRDNLGIRFLRSDQMCRPNLPSDIGAPLAHRLERGSEDGGLRDLAGLTSGDVRGSGLREMFPLFDDNPTLGPSLQAQLFVYAGLMALASLGDDRPLSALTVPYRFRIASSFAFTGQDGYQAMERSMQPGSPGVKEYDRLAFRLANHLPVQGPAVLSTMLSPSFPLSKVRKRPDLLAQLRRDDSPFRHVPQAPFCSDANCAGTLAALADSAPALLFNYPGFVNADLLLLVSADAALYPDARILEGFGGDALQTREKLARSGRHVSQSLAPFDEDAGDDLKAGGTVPGNFGAGTVVTTAEFAMANFLDITGFFVGWGQSGETGGKAHTAGVGFGGENAIIAALMMANAAFGLGVEDFGHLIAHATGTKSNSQTDLVMTARAQAAVAAALGYVGPLPRLTVGAPKAAGIGHPMAAAGHAALQEGTHYLMGQPTVGVPTLRRRLKDLPPEADPFDLSSDPVPGSLERGYIAHVQGFGGYNGALAGFPATDEFIRRLPIRDERIREAFLERRDEIRRQRIAREARWNRTAKAALRLAELHRWPGVNA